MLVTQKLPEVNGERELPGWLSCKYAQDVAEVHINYTRTVANIQERLFIYITYFGQLFKKLAVQT